MKIKNKTNNTINPTTTSISSTSKKARSSLTKAYLREELMFGAYMDLEDEIRASYSDLTL